MTKFRPCIDLHEGRVKQIVGGTLTEHGAVENFVSEQPPRFFAEKFASDGLKGGHVIKLGPGNEEAAREALAAAPGLLQLGGGINLKNAAEWLEAGASEVIVTSWLFDNDGYFLEDRLAALVAEIGREKVVLDLSCRAVEGGGWQVAMNRWQTMTELPVTLEVLEKLAGSCAEFLIHAADVEGQCQGIEEALVKEIAPFKARPLTYAGGVRNWDDLFLIVEASKGRMDATVGSALDLFGGSGLGYQELVEWNRRSR